MRSITGWRFVIAIALPILLASLGVLSLTTDLLNQVSATADAVENDRNRDIVLRALSSDAKELRRLTTENAHWDQAFDNLVSKVDEEWVRATWGNSNTLGKTYDQAYVLEQGSSMSLMALGAGSDNRMNVETAWGSIYAALMSEAQKEGSAVSFARLTDGAAMIAVAAVLPRDLSRYSPNLPTRFLATVKFIDGETIAQLESRYFVRNIAVFDSALSQGRGLVLRDVSGTPVFGMTWSSNALGAVTTSTARTKAALVLGFLMLVMGGIAVVCYRLVKNIVENEQQAVRQSLLDSLTQLPNRNAITAKLKELKQSPGMSYAVAYADLDGFKEVNDAFGHQIGDQLLQAVGAGIAELSTGALIASRMGGDEFVVLFGGEKAVAEATKFANHLIQFLEKPFELQGCFAFVGASVGIAVADASDLDDLEILRRADIAMYKAKEDGKNRFKVYEAAFDTARLESQVISRELAAFIRQRAIEVSFQPVISTRDMKISGVEALARWPHFSSRNIGPDKFIEVAESAGLIDELGELILDKACEAAKSWPGLRLAVNISAMQLNNPRFVENVLAIIERHGIPTRRIELEITETTLIRDADRAKKVFKELQRHGIKVALDDFGTGFSSIGYLRTFNFDRIKLDKSIVGKVLSSPAELAIVQGTLLVARGLSADVTAEGVEREDEIAVLKLAGCTELQGYRFYKPMPAQEIDAIVSAASNSGAMRQAG